MSTNVAAGQLRQLIERVERIEEEITSMNADKSDIYKEARSLGFDVKAMRKVVAKRKLDADDRDEQDAVFELYWNAVHGLVQVHTSARENIEEFDAETGEIIEIAAAAQGEAAAPSADRVSPAQGGSVVANTGGCDVTCSVEHAPVEANEYTSLAGGLESGIDHNFVDENTSGPDAKRAPILQSPRKAAEAVPEMAATTVATIAMVTGATTPASDSAKSAGEGDGSASVLPTNSPATAFTGAVTGWVDPPSTQTGSSDLRDANLPLTSGQTSVTVVGTERGTVINSEPKLNERCQQPSQCRFSHHPQKITCSACTAAWAVKMKAKVAA